MSGKARPNITQEDVGTLYTEDYKSIYRLTEYIPPAIEPIVVMVPLAGDGEDRRPLSRFAKFARLKPDREICEKPKRKYTRHVKPIDLSQLDIKTPMPETDLPYTATLGDRSATGETARDAIRALLAPIGLDTDEKIIAALNYLGEDKQYLLAIFNPEEGENK